MSPITSVPQQTTPVDASAPDPVAQKEFLSKWEKKANSLSPEKRSQFWHELSELYQQAGTTLLQMPSWSASAMGLSTTAISTKERLDHAAEKLFEKYQCDATQLAALEHFKKMDTAIASAKQMQFTPFTKPEKAAKAPSPWVVADLRQSMQIARAAAGTMEAVSDAKGAVIQAAGKSVAEATNYVCSRNATTQAACTNIANAAQTVAQPIVQTGKAVLDKTQIIPFLRDFRSSINESREKEAQNLANTYGLSLETTRQYMQDMETIFTGCLLGPVGKTTKNVSKSRLVQTPAPVRPAVQTTAAAASSTALPTSSTIILPNTVMPPAAPPRLILPGQNTLTPRQAANAAAQQVEDAYFPEYRRMLGKRLKPLDLPKSKGEVAWQKSLDNGVYKVKVDLLVGNVNVFELIDHLKSEALSKGASTLKIEAVIVNEKLHRVLQGRYNFSGALESHGHLEIPLNKK